MGWSRLVGWHDVDQPTAGAKLRQFSLPRFEGQPQHIEVEPLDRRRIRCAQYDVVDSNNVEGRRHGKLLLQDP